jgi:hypothetical protein
MNYFGLDWHGMLWLRLDWLGLEWSKNNSVDWFDFLIVICLILLRKVLTLSITKRTGKWHLATIWSS